MPGWIIDFHGLKGLCNDISNMESYLLWGEGFLTFAIADSLVRSDVSWPLACFMAFATGKFFYKMIAALSHHDQNEDVHQAVKEAPKAESMPIDMRVAHANHANHANVFAPIDEVDRVHEYSENYYGTDVKRVSIWNEDVKTMAKGWERVNRFGLKRLRLFYTRAN
jgi:hypothetical protein